MLSYYNYIPIGNVRVYSYGKNFIFEKSLLVGWKIINTVRKLFFIIVTLAVLSENIAFRLLFSDEFLHIIYMQINLSNFTTSVYYAM